MKKKVIAVLTIVFYMVSIFSVKAEALGNCPNIDPYSAAIVDVETGTVLMEKNGYKKRYPASITKIMTALVTLNHAKSMDEKVIFNKKAVTAEDLESKTLWLMEGETLSLRDCLYGLLLESANDIAKGLAFHIGGSLEGFAAMMNEKAKSLGCQNTHFSNPHGLFEEEHYTCAVDMAKIMRACAENPRFVEIAGTVRYTIPKTNKFEYRRFLLNDSKMLLSKNMYYYDKCYGAKTGYTNESRKTYVAMAKNGKLRLAGAVMGTNSLDGQYKSMEAMFEQCFKQYKYVAANKFPLSFEKKGNPIYSAILEKDKDAKLWIMKNEKLILPKEYKKAFVSTEIVYDKLNRINVGVNQVGTIIYYYDGVEVGKARLHYASYNQIEIK